ncbi:hypothetical protein ABW45_04560 [Stenotrophomonas maltophilia]|nr:hypothetical protein ABW45_04560 [Stenotrophomonas maltophilia]
MNKDNAKAFLPLVQALAEGRVIEHRGSGGWYQLNNPTFQDPPSDYRIKPEPREIWVNRYPNGMENGIFSTEHAAKLHRANDTAVQIRYREVIE